MNHNELKNKLNIDKFISLEYRRSYLNTSNELLSIKEKCYSKNIKKSIFC